mmetsp:Transcript_3078/g.9400  ORF Transcript_3078/g.9400 Transcript_3078/m.9400 type:complete len:85 (+) Transcript_3078:216-470(+)|eukprot:scaffold257280_cov32-Tisochrysis_lutea.AAC.2
MSRTSQSASLGSTLNKAKSTQVFRMRLQPTMDASHDGNEAPHGPNPSCLYLDLKMPGGPQLEALQSEPELALHIEAYRRSERDV